MGSDSARPTAMPPVAIPAPKPIEPESLFPTDAQLRAQQQELAASPNLLSMATPTPKCNGRLNMLQAESDPAYIHSPNFGFGEYYASDKCYWLIAAEPNMRIEFAFVKFNVGENSPVCADDSVQIFSGVSSGAGLLGKYCGNNVPPVSMTPGRLGLVVFQSNAMRHYPGFQLSYRAVRKFNFLFFYIKNQLRKFIAAGPGSPIDSLPIDRQEILDNARVEVDRPGSNDLIPGPGAQRCNNQIWVTRADSSQRLIRSPNFVNGKYYSNDNCTWKIWTDPGLTVICQQLSLYFLFY